MCFFSIDFIFLKVAILSYEDNFVETFFLIKNQDLCIDRADMEEKKNNWVIIYISRLLFPRVLRLPFIFFTNSK